ncbi:MAG TPA: fibronectin type III-like domain-contianing protein, partial [Terriglobales bacterium]|nr:fibronectin type III-like domain-contianing protein [Terriglobales bacterium]
RVHIEPGATEHVQIAVPNRNLSIVDLDGVRKIVPGELQVWVGGGQPAGREGLPKTAGVSGSVSITGEATLPK